MTEGMNQPADLVDATGPLDPRAQAEALAAGREDESEAGDIEVLREELAGAQEEAANNREKHLRALADMENYKKRMERTYSDLARTKHRSLLGKVLAVKDNLERALQYGQTSADSGEGIMEGVRLTQYQLDQLLAQEGLEPIEALGKPFDPKQEDAIQSVHDPNVPDQQVVQVVRTGYVFPETGEVLRPSQVIVNIHSEDE